LKKPPEQPIAGRRAAYQAEREEEVQSAMDIIAFPAQRCYPQKYL
jgi:hypothetical protein